MECKSPLCIVCFRQDAVWWTAKKIDGISKTMLSSTLKMLEEHGLVIREQFNEVPPHVEYSLTEGGEALKGVFVEIARWSSKYLK